MRKPATAPSRRERVLAAGREAFGRRPYDEVSLAEIAKDAGVAHGLPFHYFTNKRGLFLEVVRSLADEMRIIHDFSADLPPRQVLRAALLRHIAYLEQHPHVLLGPLRGTLGIDPDVRAVFEEVRWDGAVATLTMIGIDDPTDGTRMLVRAWMAYQDDLLAQWLLDRSVDRERIVDVLVTSLEASLQSVSLIEADTRLDVSVLQA